MNDSTRDNLRIRRLSCYKYCLLFAEPVTEEATVELGEKL